MLDGSRLAVSKSIAAKFSILDSFENSGARYLFPVGKTSAAAQSFLRGRKEIVQAATLLATLLRITLQTATALATVLQITLQVATALATLLQITLQAATVLATLLRITLQVATVLATLLRITLQLATQ